MEVEKGTRAAVNIAVGGLAGAVRRRLAISQLERWLAVLEDREFSIQTVSGRPKYLTEPSRYPPWLESLTYSIAPSQSSRPA